MDPFGGKEELVEVKFQISQDQKKWLEKLVKEGKIAVPPGGSLSVGNVASIFIRALLHNAMEQQAAMEKADADEDEEYRRVNAMRLHSSGRTRRCAPTRLFIW